VGEWGGGGTCPGEGPHSGLMGVTCATLTVIEPASDIATLSHRPARTYQRFDETMVLECD
jgi:hypothetical protein